MLKPVGLFPIPARPLGPREIRGEINKTSTHGFAVGDPESRVERKLHGLSDGRRERAERREGNCANKGKRGERFNCDCKIFPGRSFLQPFQVVSNDRAPSLSLGDSS